MARRWALTFLRVVVSGALLALLVSRVGVDLLVFQLAQIDLRYLVLAFVMQSGGIVLSALKWRRFLSAELGPLPLGALVRFYLIGSFFNNFLPSSVGGDVVRAWQTARAYGARGAVVRSILLERLTGVASILALCLVSAAVLLLTHPVVRAAARELPLAWAGAVALLAGLTVVAGRRWWYPRAGARWRELVALPGGLRTPRLWTATMLISFAFQINVALIVWLVGRALHLPLALWPVLLCMPIISLLGLLPFTINGFGVRESSFVVLFGLFGVSAASALVWSLMVYLVVAVTSLAGGALYALQPAASRAPARPGR